MREIKFRAWAPEDKCIYGWEDMNHMSVKDISADTAWKYMQFTGLKDKNGKDIYEGDIVKLAEWEPSIYQVGFDRGAFCFWGSNETEGAYYNDAKYLQDCEIIGNIYEHLHLLSNEA